MDRFLGTILPQTNDPTQIQKAILDLLSKINRSYSDLSLSDDALSSEINGVISPLSSTIAADTTFSEMPTTQGVYRIYIPTAYLVASSGGPFTLTLSNGVGSTILVPISASGDTITSDDLLFEVYVDPLGNLISGSWQITGSNSNGTYEKSNDGSMIQRGLYPVASCTFAAAGSIFLGGMVPTIPFPTSFNSTEYSVADKAYSSSSEGIWTGQRGTSLRTVSQYSVYLWAFEGATINVGVEWSAVGRWRA